MIFNSSMKHIIESMDDKIIYLRDCFKINRYENLSGKPFWCVGNFLGVVNASNRAGKDLTDFEWEVNEIFLNDSLIIRDLVRHGMAIVDSWKLSLELQHPNICFDILMSVDSGDKDIDPSVTLRFWAIRDDYHYINPSIDELEKFKINPTLMEQVNYSL